MRRVDARDNALKDVLVEKASKSRCGGRNAASVAWLVHDLVSTLKHIILEMLHELQANVT